MASSLPPLRNRDQETSNQESRAQDQELIHVMNIMDLGLPLVHAARTDLILRQARAMWLRIVSKPIWDQKRAMKTSRKLQKIKTKHKWGKMN